MIDKILIWAWVLLGSILVIENLVVWYTALLFLDRNALAWTLSLFSIFIGILIWYWSRWFIMGKNKKESIDDYDF